MIFTDYVKNLTNEEVLELIDDYRECHFKSGILNPNSKIRHITNAICNDFQIPYDLTYGEKALCEEIMDRFYNEHKK